MHVGEADRDGTRRRRRSGVATLVAVLGMAIAPGVAHAAVTWSIDDAPIVTEGDSGTKQATFTVTASGLTFLESETIHYATVNGTAAAPQDFTATQGDASVTGPLLGDTDTATVSVPIAGDTTPEFDETFTVVLSNPSSGTIADGTGVGTIRNDDAPRVSVSDPTASESAGTITFTVSLDGAIDPVDIPYQTADGTAKAGTDYTAANGSLHFDRGDASHTVAVPIADNSLYEGPSKSFTLSATKPAQAAADSKLSGTGTITDDDLPRISIADVAIPEGNAPATPLTFTVALDHKSALTTTVHVFTSDGTAKAGSDFVALGDTVVSFAPGEQAQQVTVQVVGDATPEADEFFGLVMAGPENGAIADPAKPYGLGGILNDDLPGQGGGIGGVPAGSPGDQTPPAITLSKPRSSRGTILVSITCPATEILCRGTLTTFSKAKRHSKVHALRRERRLGRATFVIQGGQTASITTRLKTKLRRQLRRVRNVKVRSFAVARDNAGNLATVSRGATIKRLR